MTIAFYESTVSHLLLALALADLAFSSLRFHCAAFWCSFRLRVLGKVTTGLSFK